MKKIVFLLVAMVCLSANAAMLSSEVVQDFKKICIYSDGSTITISSMGICPLSK